MPTALWGIGFKMRSRCFSPILRTMSREDQ